jgi:hypothetical protein
MCRFDAMPAIFLIFGRRLEASRRKPEELLDEPLFRIASPGYWKRMVGDHVFCGPATSEEQKPDQILKPRQIIEQLFEGPCVGFQTRCRFADGLTAAVGVPELFQESGRKYVNALSSGSGRPVPTPLRRLFNHGVDGFPGIRKLPGRHGTLLKHNNKWGLRHLPPRLSPMLEAIPADFVKTVESKFAVNRVFLEQAQRGDKLFISLIRHPLLFQPFDTEMKMLKPTFSHIRKLGVEPRIYYADLYKQVLEEKV